MQNFKKPVTSDFKKKWQILSKQIKNDVKTAHDSYVNNLSGEVKK